MILPVAPEATGYWCIKPRIHPDSAEADHAEGVSHYINAAYRLPKTDLESKLGRITAEAGWIPTGISRVFLVHRCQRCPTDLERKHA